MSSVIFPHSIHEREEGKQGSKRRKDNIPEPIKDDEAAVVRARNRWDSFPRRYSSPLQAAARSLRSSRMPFRPQRPSARPLTDSIPFSLGLQGFRQPVARC